MDWEFQFMHTITRKLKEANGSDGDGVELGSATQKLKDSRKVTRKYVIFNCLLIFPCGLSFSFPRNCVFFFFLGTHLFLVCDHVSVWLQGNLRKINVERVKNFWILSRFDVLVSGNCNAWLIWAEIVVPDLVLEFLTLWVPFGTYKFYFLIPYFS